MTSTQNKGWNIVIALVLFLNTAGGIKNGQTCYFESDTADLLKTVSQEGILQEGGCIRCSDGTSIDTVYVAKVSATGTPPHLMFTNYVGAYYPEQPYANMPGQARRYIFFDGRPVEKDQKN